MIKSYTRFISENLTSLVDRYKKQAGIRKEDMLTPEYVESFAAASFQRFKEHEITILIENGKQIVDVEGNFEVNPNMINDGKLPFKFGKVTGDFYCSKCNLTTLENCPDYVGGIFNCSCNKLTSLEHAPKYIGSNANISNANSNSVKKFTSFDLSSVSDVQGYINI